MNEFTEALLCDRLSSLIPEEDDFFGALLGSWDFKRRSLEADGTYIDTIGEWIFSRALEGKAIQDVFIWPPRNQRTEATWEGEYGTTLRTYNRSTRNWDIVYTNGGFIGKFTAVKDGSRIVQTTESNPNMRWTFSDITENSFRWSDTRLELDGSWRLYEELRLTRKK